MSYPKNAATPKEVTVGSVVLIATGAVQTSDCLVRVSLDSGAWGAGGGTLDYDATSGVVTYAPTQAETNGAVLMIAVYKASCIGCSTTVLMDLQSADNNTILAHADYGNAKLVRSTAPANTLDVSATGEAGLDFANIKDATGAHTLTNITVPTVTTLTNAPSDSTGVTEILTRLPDATAGEAGGLFIAGTNAETTITTALNANVIGNITGNLSGSVGSVTTKTGYSLASTGLDLVTAWTTDITGTVSGNSTHDAAAVKTAIEAPGSHLTLILEDTGTTIPGLMTTAQSTLTKLDSMIEEIA